MMHGQKNIKFPGEVFLEKQIVHSLVRKFHIFYGSQCFVPLFTPVLS